MLATTGESGVAPARTDLGSIAWAPGISEHQVEVEGQGSRSLAIWIPKASAPRSVFIFLHGTLPPGIRDQAASALLRRLLACLAAPALEFLAPVIIAPRSEDGQWWNVEDTALVLGLVRASRERWPGVGARSVIGGYSNGGIGTWYFARLYPEYFAAAVPIAFNDTIVGSSPLPIYAIQGTKDELFDIGPVRRAIHALARAGQDITFDEKYRASHLDFCSYRPELERAGHWLEAHAFPLRSRCPRPGAF